MPAGRPQPTFPPNGGLPPDAFHVPQFVCPLGPTSSSSLRADPLIVSRVFFFNKPACLCTPAPRDRNIIPTGVLPPQLRPAHIYIPTDYLIFGKGIPPKTLTPQGSTQDAASTARVGLELRRFRAGCVVHPLQGVFSKGFPRVFIKNLNCMEPLWL